MHLPFDIIPNIIFYISIILPNSKFYLTIIFFSAYIQNKIRLFCISIKHLAISNILILTLKKPRKLGAFEISIFLILSLAELRSSTSCFETVLNSFERRFSLVFRAFPAFQCSVVLFLNQGKWCIFNQHPAS